MTLYTIENVKLECAEKMEAFMNVIYFIWILSKLMNMRKNNLSIVCGIGGLEGRHVPKER